MKAVLEVARIMIIALLIGTVGSVVLQQIYTRYGANESAEWMGFLAIWLLIFVLYRNKLQFSGWYKGGGREKLPKRAFWILISISIILLALPFFQ